MTVTGMIAVFLAFLLIALTVQFSEIEKKFKKLEERLDKLERYSKRV